MTNYTLKNKDLEPRCTLCGRPIFNFCRCEQKYHPGCAERYRRIIRKPNNDLINKLIMSSIKT